MTIDIGTELWVRDEKVRVLAQVPARRKPARLVEQVEEGLKEFCKGSKLKTCRPPQYGLDITAGGAWSEVSWLVCTMPDRVTWTVRIYRVREEELTQTQVVL